jgi:hypothetical protein
MRPKHPINPAAESARRLSGDRKRIAFDGPYDPQLGYVGGYCLGRLPTADEQANMMEPEEDET